MTPTMTSMLHQHTIEPQKHYKRLLQLVLIRLQPVNQKFINSIKFVSNKSDIVTFHTNQSQTTQLNPLPFISIHIGFKPWVFQIVWDAS